MTQLILDTTGYNVVLPESQKEKYRAYPEDLASEVLMVTGRIIKELRGKAWQISYQYGYFNDEDKNRLIAACEKGKRQPILCSFLPPSSSGQLIPSKFLVTAFEYPKFMWSSIIPGQDGNISAPIWADFSLELREVNPSD